MKFTKNALTAVLLSTFALPGASFAAHPATWSEFVTSSKQQMQKNHPQQSPAASATQRQKPMSANHPPASYADIVEIRLCTLAGLSQINRLKKPDGILWAEQR